MKLGWLRGAAKVVGKVLGAADTIESAYAGSPTKVDKMEAVAGLIVPEIVAALHKERIEDVSPEVGEATKDLIDAYVRFQDVMSKHAPTEAPRLGAGYSAPIVPSANPEGGLVYSAPKSGVVDPYEVPAIAATGTDVTSETLVPATTTEIIDPVTVSSDETTEVTQ